METKDWVNLSMSATALAISIIATAVPLFRTVDDIRLVINHLPILKVSEDGTSITLTGELSLAIINAGNRPALITRTELQIVSPEDRKYQQPDDCTGQVIRTGIESFVVKEKDIVTQKVTAGGAPIKTALGTKGTTKMCLSFTIATPFFAENHKDIEIATANLETGTASTGYVNYGTPIVLLRSTGTVWDGP